MSGLEHGSPTVIAANRATAGRARKAQPSGIAMYEHQQAVEAEVHAADSAYQRLTTITDRLNRAQRQWEDVAHNPNNQTNLRKGRYAAGVMLRVDRTHGASDRRHAAEANVIRIRDKLGELRPRVEAAAARLRAARDAAEALRTTEGWAKAEREVNGAKTAKTAKTAKSAAAAKAPRAPKASAKQSSAAQVAKEQRAAEKAAFAAADAPLRAGNPAYTKLSSAKEGGRVYLRAPDGQIVEVTNTPAGSRFPGDSRNWLTISQRTLGQGDAQTRLARRADVARAFRDYKVATSAQVKRAEAKLAAAATQTTPAPKAPKTPNALKTPKTSKNGAPRKPRTKKASRSGQKAQA